MVLNRALTDIAAENAIKQRTASILTVLRQSTSLAMAYPLIGFAESGPLYGAAQTTSVMNPCA